ncbi:MAG: hypothetical protein H7831_13630 [Magnetococcus sp. WYHC-3]
MNDSQRLTWVTRALTALALALLVASYFSPVWWVSLKAPQYPESAFPDGIRIHFHFNGVKNGCQAQVSSELEYGEGLDCVEEMDTINHYVGMAPTSAGGPIERGMSHYSFSILGLMLLVFMLPTGRGRLALLGGGYLAIFLWMCLDLWHFGHLEVIAKGFAEGMAAFFNDQVRISQEVTTLKRNTALVVGVYALLMASIFAALVWKGRDRSWILAAIPAALPGIFVVDYAAWLYWFGHNLHPWGAFTVKEFMPTVFGDGKVAQFSTHSYPHLGFFLMVVMALVLLVALLLRRKATRLAQQG